MSNSWLLKHILVLDPAAKSEQVLDVRVENEVITEMSEELSVCDGEKVLNGQGLWLTPGFIDIHTHLRDFAQSDRETIETGTRAAAAGGYTTVLAMANTDPPMDNVALLSLLLDKIKTYSCITVLPAACVTKGMAGSELTNMRELAEFGVKAFSDDGKPVSNLAVLRRALQYVRPTGCTVISHPEDENLSSGGAIRESARSTSLGLPSYPSSAESAAVAREIEVALECGGRLHFAHISTKRSVELIRQAKAAGGAITADVTPHHLTLSVNDIKDYDTSCKMNPPLSTEVAALVSAVKDGTIDAIATDHAPHTARDKSRPFEEAPFGIIGLETAFSLLLEKLVLSKEIPVLKLITLLTTGPAKVLGLPVPVLQKGSPANLVVINPNQRWLYDSRKGFSRSHNSPYTGRQLTGKVVLTVANGKVVYQDQNVAAIK